MPGSPGWPTTWPLTSTTRCGSGGRSWPGCTGPAADRLRQLPRPGRRYGAGNYGMCGRAYDPRFLFSWPSAKSAVMGPAQLAGVLSIVGRQAAAARGEPYDEAADAAMRAAVEEQIEAESQAFFLS